MAVRGGAACIKQYLLVVNSLLSICGMVLLIFGFWMWINNKQAEDFDVESSSTTFYGTMYLLMGAGAFMVLQGALGCFGAGQESVSLLGTYFVFLLVSLVVELAVAVAIYTNQDGVVSLLQNLYTYAYLKFLKTEKTSLGLTLKMLHHALDCCGVTGVLDQIISNTCPARSGLAVFTLQPCSSAIAALFNNQGHAMLGVWLGLGGVTILAMVFTVILMAGIRGSRGQWERLTESTEPIILSSTYQWPQQAQLQMNTQSPQPTDASPPYPCDVESGKI